MILTWELATVVQAFMDFFRYSFCVIRADGFVNEWPNMFMVALMYTSYIISCTRLLA